MEVEGWHTAAYKRDLARFISGRKKMKTIYADDDVNVMFDALKSLLSRDKNYERVTDSEALEFLIKYYNDKSNV